MKNNLTTRGQTLIELACIGGALLVWLILLMLGGLTEVFFYILIAYHLIGGLINRDLAKNSIIAILLAPVYVGRKIAMYIQSVTIEDNFKSLTTKELIEINNAVSDIIAKHPSQKNDPMAPVLYGCATYGELEEFNKRIVSEYNRRK